MWSSVYVTRNELLLVRELRYGGKLGVVVIRNACVSRGA
jgi:hypothetical protein